MERSPEYLYRYTNIGALRYMLLPPHTIRFNPLTLMDDKTEMLSRTRDMKGVRLTKDEGQFMMISCWTDMEQECLKMYRDYCNPNDHGIRIRMPVNPFSLTENKLSLDMNNDFPELVNLTADALAFHFGREIPLEEIQSAKAKMKTEAPDFYQAIAEKEDEIAHRIISCMTRDVDKLLIQMKYTDSIDKLIPTVITVRPNISYGIYEHFGMNKDTSWAWQREWRYVLWFNRFIKGHIKVDGSAESYSLPFDHYDLILDMEKLKEMEITLSPMISSEARDEVEEIVGKSGLHIPVINSQLACDS